MGHGGQGVTASPHIIRGGAQERSVLRYYLVPGTWYLVPLALATSNHCPRYSERGRGQADTRGLQEERRRTWRTTGLRRLRPGRVVGRSPAGGRSALVPGRGGRPTGTPSQGPPLRAGPAHQGH